MKEPTRLVLEAPVEKDRRYVFDQIRRGVSIYVIEPFHAYHHQGELMFFPPPLPPFIEDLLKVGDAHLISAKSIGSKDIYFLAAERAVQHVEEIYPFYRVNHEPLISAIVEFLDSHEAERIFKKRLSEQLAFFYSVNITLERLRNVLGPGKLIIHSKIDIHLYQALELLITQVGGITIHKDSQINLSVLSRRRAYMRVLRRSASILTKILVQFLASFVFKRQPEITKEIFKYGFAITSPQRQFRGNMRGPGFLIDGNKIIKSDVAFCPLVPLEKNHGSGLRGMGSAVIQLPLPGTYFSDWRKWLNLLKESIREMPFCYREVEGAAANLFNYLRWKYVLSRKKIEHFITHADFGHIHISRNIAMKQSGTSTWYFTDASNFGLNFRDENGSWNRHPFWTYLYYDHFVTWYEYLGHYFAIHPGMIPDTKTIGCLWSQHIRKGNKSSYSLVFRMGEEQLDNLFKIVVFSSTYTVNGITSYDEAIAFMQDIRRLADELEQVVVIIKEKKAKELHLRADPEKGSQLLGILDDMSRNPRLEVFTRDADTSQLIGDSDMCISFPFSSPTIEALSVDRPAIWHDPLGIYTRAVYSEFDHIVTHGYDELKETVLKHIKNRGNKYENPIPQGHPMLDPFRDGKAIERFRDLLCAAE